MEKLVICLLIAAVFLIGFVIIGKMGKFVRRNPKAFPGQRRIVKVNSSKEDIWEDDEI